jgi:iron complex transport system substrate-binding protein
VVSLLYALGGDAAGSTPRDRERHQTMSATLVTVRPGRAGTARASPQARKPRVSAFTSAKIDRILALQPDLAIGFSDMQADIAQALVKAGVEVWISNHRSIEGILGYVRAWVRWSARLSGRGLCGNCCAPSCTAVRQRPRAAAARPRVYFEEWDQPQISAIRWVSELVAIAGGDDIFPQRARQPGARPHRRRRRRRWCAPRPTSSSARGAARSSAPSRWRRGPAGAAARPR